MHDTITRFLSPRARTALDDYQVRLTQDQIERFFDCSWSLLNHGVAQTMRLNLGNLNPIYERELTKLGVYHEVEGS